MRLRNAIFLTIMVMPIFSAHNLFGLSSLRLQWENYNRGIKELGVLCLAVHPTEQGIIFAGTDRAIYKSEDSGKNWQEVLGASGRSREINYLNFNPDSPNELYAATGVGLFVSNNAGKTWRKIFSGVGKTEEECLCVKVYQGIIFLGTRKALFLSFNHGKTWQRVSGIPSNTQIVDIAIDKDAAYLATSAGVYQKGDTWEEWNRIVVSFMGEENENEDGEEEVKEEGVSGQTKINKIILDPLNSRRIFIATTKGILTSEDKGKSWQGFSSAGFLDGEVRDILISRKDGRQFAVTKRGAYVFADDRWQQLYQGLIIEEANAIKENSVGEIWLGGKGGIYKLAKEDAALSISPSLNPLDSDFKNEPTIQELQKVAINYAEVAPQKIRNWRRQAQIKAIMPEVSVDYDKTVTTALGATYDRVSTGPMDWGVNLKWNIGELIWNNDQTSIDSRSKLMVELRDDIINELTRLFFERRRLQMEIVVSPSLSENEKMEKELRLQELTALIDGLTGGYLSQSLNKNKM